MSAVATLALAACAPADEDDASSDDSSSETVTLDDCQVDDLPLTTPGILTIATDTPAYEPWFADDDPTNGEGFESAVAYAVAGALGFDDADVEWVTQGFNQAVQPGKKSWDFDINQFSITEDREKAVDFSTPYYEAAQAVITKSDSDFADVTSLSDLADAKLGAQVGTTSLTAIDQIDPSTDPLVYDDTTKAAQALENGQVDAVVADLPTAFYLVAAELDDATIAGQFQPTTGETEAFGLLLSKDSELTPCVSVAVDSLREDGTLADLEEQWLSQSTDVPVLQQ